MAGKRDFRLLAMFFAAAIAAAVVALLATGGLASAQKAPSGTAVTKTPLKVLDVSPEGGSRDVPTDTDFVVTFNDPPGLDTNTIDTERNLIFKRKGAKRSISFGWSIDLSVAKPFEKLYIFPTNPLKPETTYQIILKGGKNGLKSRDGGQLGKPTDPSVQFKNGNVIWTFRTASG